MEKLTKIKLNVLCEQNLDEKEMNELSGGCRKRKNHCTKPTEPTEPTTCQDPMGDIIDVVDDGGNTSGGHCKPKHHGHKHRHRFCFGFGHR